MKRIERQLNFFENEFGNKKNEFSQLLDDDNYDDENKEQFKYNYDNLNTEQSRQTEQIKQNLETNPVNKQENYFIYENNENNDYLDKVSYQDFETLEERESRMSAELLNYDMNFNLRQLEHILSYYEIPKKKMNKSEVIEKIVQIENNPENREIVSRRHEMFRYAEALKKDKYFNKYILFNFL